MGSNIGFLIDQLCRVVSGKSLIQLVDEFADKYIIERDKRRKRLKRNPITAKQAKQIIKEKYGRKHKA